MYLVQGKTDHFSQQGKACLLTVLAFHPASQSPCWVQSLQEEEEKEKEKEEEHTFSSLSIYMMALSFFFSFFLYIIFSIYSLFILFVYKNMGSRLTFIVILFFIIFLGIVKNIVYIYV